MPDQIYNSPRYSGLKERLADQGDGTHAPIVMTIPVVNPVEAYMLSASWQVTTPGGDYDIVELIGGDPVSRISYLFRFTFQMSVTEQNVKDIQVSIERRASTGLGGSNTVVSPPGKFDSNNHDPAARANFFATPPPMRGELISVLYARDLVVKKSDPCEFELVPLYPIVLRSKKDVLVMRVNAPDNVNPSFTVGVVFGEKGL